MKIGLYIPCFNAERYIADVLKGVFAQTLTPDVVVVVDDASTDNTTEIVLRFPVRVLRHKKNQGVAASRNTAIKNIDAEFIAALDADCVPQADWLERLINQFTSSEVAGVGGKVTEKHCANVCDLWRAVHMKQHWGEKELSPSFLFGANTVFRRKLLLENGLYNENYTTNYEDVDICNRLKDKGYAFSYEPKAISYHLKSDNLYSLLNNYWHWRLGYYRKQRYYSNNERFLLKIKDAIFLSDQCISEDINSRRHQLLYIDFLMVFHHLLKDFEYLISKDEQVKARSSQVRYWLSLLDLTFFYHFDYTKDNLSTLMPKNNAILQNFFAFILVLGDLIQERFKVGFRKILYQHLFLSTYKIEDVHLLDKLLSLIELSDDWRQFCRKTHPNFNSLFLKGVFYDVQKWLDGLDLRFPKITQIIELSAENIDK